MRPRASAEGRRIGRFVSMTSRRQPARGFRCSVSKTSQDNLDPKIALHDLGVVGVVKFQGLSESKDVFLTPVPGQRGNDLSASEAWQRRSRWVASTAGSRSPATRARMIRIPVSPVRRRSPRDGVERSSASTPSACAGCATHCSPAGAHVGADRRAMRPTRPWV